MAQETKSARLEARVAPDVRQMIVAAAALEGRTVSEFLVASAKERAEAALQRQTIIELSAEDQERFVNALISPQPLNAAMKRAVDRRAKLFESS